MSPSLASIEYFPSKSVETPVVVPSMITVAPAKGNPDSSETVPETFLFCANEICTTSANRSVSITLNFVFIFVKYLN